MAWDTVLGQRALESICGMEKEVSDISRKQISLRDYFAAQALAGFLACPTTGGNPDEFAKQAYRFADAMIKAKETKED